MPFFCLRLISILRKVPLSMTFSRIYTLLTLVDGVLCVLSGGDEMFQILGQVLSPIASISSISSEKLIQAMLLLSVTVLGVFSLYLVGFDQGYLFAIFQGHSALTQNMLHELVHDARHVAAFPCH
jgi:hypothetical protein